VPNASEQEKKPSYNKGGQQRKQSNTENLSTAAKMGGCEEQKTDKCIVAIDMGEGEKVKTGLVRKQKGVGRHWAAQAIGGVVSKKKNLRTATKIYRPSVQMGRPVRKFDILGAKGGKRTIAVKKKDPRGTYLEKLRPARVTFKKRR